METPTLETEPAPAAPDVRFVDFALSKDIRLAVQTCGYEIPTPIQARAIPFALEGRDVIGSAQTGTGKTAAFGLPLLSRHENARGLRILVIEPTRELALQVEAAFQTFTKFSPLRCGVVYGGVGYGQQSAMLKRGVEALIATPGRVLDFIERGEIDLSGIDAVVLDEADRLLDMGFMPDVRRIVDHCKGRSQTLLFSATMPPEIEQLIKWAMKNPEIIEIGIRRAPAESVTHCLYPVAADQKLGLLRALLEAAHYESVIVFCRTKIMADRVAAALQESGHPVAVMHSDRNQKEREDALSGFRDGRYEVLVATDLAARGLDIATVTHVINFDVPEHAEDYVHRIGRTGRAAKEGDAFTIFTVDDINHVLAIERYISMQIERRKMETFAYNFTTLLNLKPNESLTRLKITGGRVGKGYSFGKARR